MTSELKFSAWLAPVGMVVLFIALIPLTHFIPPPSPALDADAIKTLYEASSVGIRIASMLLMVGSVCFFVFFIAISVAMMRMQPNSILLSATQAFSGIVGFAPVIYAAFFFAAASFRPERAPELVLTLSDLAWFMMIMPAPIVTPQLLVIGIAILKDRAGVFPRWVAYVNFWTALLFQPGVLVPLFKHGPFAWDGLFAFWVPFSVFFLWALVMCWGLLKLKDQ